MKNKLMLVPFWYIVIHAQASETEAPALSQEKDSLQKVSQPQAGQFKRAFRGVGTFPSKKASKRTSYLFEDFPL